MSFAKRFFSQVVSVECQLLSRVLQAAERFWTLAPPYLALPARPDMTGWNRVESEWKWVRDVQSYRVKGCRKTLEKRQDREICWTRGHQDLAFVAIAKRLGRTEWHWSRWRHSALRPFPLISVLSCTVFHGGPILACTSCLKLPLEDSWPKKLQIKPCLRIAGTRRVDQYFTDFFDLFSTHLFCLYCPSIFCIFCLSEEGDKLTFDLGPDVPGIVLDAEDRESWTNSISARDMTWHRYFRMFQCSTVNLKLLFGWEHQLLRTTFGQNLSIWQWQTEFVLVRTGMEYQHPSLPSLKNESD